MPYVPDAILFDGTTDALERGSLTGVADGKVGTWSVWFRVDGQDGAERRQIGNAAGFDIRLDSNNQLRVQFANDVGGTIAIFRTTATFLASSSSWHHFLTSWDLASATSQIYIDDVSDIVVAVPLVDDLIDYTSNTWAVGARPITTSLYDGALSDPWFTTDHLDLSVEANRRKFIDAAGNPVFLGVSGEEPTSSPASIYLRGNQTDQGINSGTGGDFVSQATQVPGETTGPVANATSSASGLVNGPMFHELESAAGYITGPAFRLGSNKWTNQFVAPDTLCALEGSNDKLNWRIVADNFNRPISALADVMRVGGDRTTWLRFVIAADAMEPRLFTAIIQNQKLLEEGRQ